MAYLEATGHSDQELPYSSIVALNANGATLHYQLRSRARSTRFSMLIDAGASHLGYASDITRTYAAKPGRFADLIAAMDHAQQALCAAVQIGVDWRDLHLSAHNKAAQILCDAQILRLAPADAVATGLTRAFLPHGLGHLLGLQVHDVAGFREAPMAETIAPPVGHEALRLTRRLQRGFVVTVEPGLYFIDSLLAATKAGPNASAVNWPLIEELRPYGGIRIEDDVLVTATGHENLTRAAFAATGAGENLPLLNP
jgi:Xaa-Pro dipeptidase